MIRNRFQTQEIYHQQDGVTTYRGVDPLTGLPVLVYVFPGRPTVEAGTLESENIPGILATHVDDDGGHVVAAFSPQYGLVAPGESVIDDRFALDALRAVRDAARSGVVHGDLRPGRLLYADGHVLVEGYGVPWRPADESVRAPEAPTDAPGDLRADVYAIAATLLLLGRDNLSGGVRAALRGAVQAGAGDRPTASALYNEVRRLSGGVVTPPPQRFEELTLPVAEAEAEPPAERDRSLSATRADFRLDLDLDLDLELPDEPAPSGSAGAAPPLRSGAADAEPGVFAVPPDPPATDGRGPDEPEPITLHSDPGLEAARPDSRRTRDSGGGFVKDLPPGATYRAGQLDGSPPAAPVRLTHERAPQRRRRSWRGPLLVLLVVVLAGAAASLAFLNRGAVTPSRGGAVSFIVDVSVSPTDLPPVDLVVLQSPDGSGSPPGTILTSVPRKVVFDHPGTWVVQGVFRGRRSRPATVTLPGDRSTIIRFDPLPASGSQR